MSHLRVELRAIISHLHIRRQVIQRGDMKMKFSGFGDFAEASAETDQMLTIKTSSLFH